MKITSLLFILQKVFSRFVATLSSSQILPVSTIQAFFPLLYASKHASFIFPILPGENNATQRHRCEREYGTTGCSTKIRFSISYIIVTQLPHFRYYSFQFCLFCVVIVCHCVLQNLIQTKNSSCLQIFCEEFREDSNSH